MAKRAERFDQHFAAFFFVQSAKKKKKSLFAQRRKALEKFLTSRGKIDIGRGRAVIHNRFIAVIERKRFTSQTPFFFGSKQDGSGVPEHAILRPRPVE